MGKSRGNMWAIFSDGGLSPRTPDRVLPWAHDVITPLWRQNDVATSFWRHNDVIIALCVRLAVSRSALLLYPRKFHSTEEYHLFSHKDWAATDKKIFERFFSCLGFHISCLLAPPWRHAWHSRERGLSSHTNEFFMDISVGVFLGNEC